MTVDNDDSGLVSVVIPTYNRPEFLERAITTALGQTYDEIEVVVVDDGSTEPYAERIVSEHSDSVRFVRHDRNRGLSAARNTGIAESNGAFVAFLDDDDLWHEDKLSRQVAALRDDDRFGLATCLVVSVSMDDQIIHCESTAPHGDCSEELLVCNEIGTPSRVLVRRECLDDIGGFDESLPTKQDWDFYLRICQDWTIAAVESHLCFRTIHESMSSSSDAVERDNQAILEKHEGTIKENGLWQTAKAEIDERIGNAYLKAGEFTPARAYLKESFVLAPTLRRGTLLALSCTHPRVVDQATDLKRMVAARRSGCRNVELTPDTVPGIDK